MAEDAPSWLPPSTRTRETYEPTDLSCLRPAAIVASRPAICAAAETQLRDCIRLAGGDPTTVHWGTPVRDLPSSAVFDAYIDLAGCRFFGDLVLSAEAAQRNPYSPVS
jgi:hypothetical protein